MDKLLKSDLFTALARYADQQDENFLTESLVYLLNLLIEREQQAAIGILNNLCGEKTSGWFENSQDISLTTQYTIQEGRPDIVIEIEPDKLIFVEVKNNSGLGMAQLERYYAHLQGYQQKSTQLVLLTRSRHSIQQTSLQRSLFHHVCWYEISGWLSDADLHDEVAVFMVNQFLGFLKRKEMNMEKITWEYMQGVPAMVNLISMIGTALSEVAPEKSTKKTVGASWAGFYMDGFFVGFRFNNCLTIVFENNQGTAPTFKRDLNLEKAHFFSLNSGEQLESLINFLKDSLAENPLQNS